jgi:hypothetical protein
MWNNFVQTRRTEINRLLPMYENLQDEYREFHKNFHKTKRQNTKHYGMNCPTMDCVGKLAGDGTCGLCSRHYCHECMKETSDGHECRQEDVETIRELRKNTRPCPKCNIPIYKIEGCDQMWCVQCHTTFSWKTGAIVHGVVHNPHFYDYRRQMMGDAVQRTPGDIPCGGMPNEIEILHAVSRDQNPRMYDIWEIAVRISENQMPPIYRKFHNTRPVKYRRYSISYLRGKIDKNRLGVLLYKNYLDEIRYSHYYGILETFIDNMAEYMRQFVNGTNTEKECLALLNIAEEAVLNMNKKYNMKEKLVRRI